MIFIFDPKKSEKSRQSKRKPEVQASMLGSTPEEMLPFLISGDPDDLSVEFTDDQL